MYQRLHMWDEALSLAAAKAHPGLSQLKEAHMAWLMDSGQNRFQLSQLKEAHMAWLMDSGQNRF
jgi:hypothetical protein